MTADDTPLDDAIARAARDGLRHLAGSHAPTQLDWAGVEGRARQVRLRRGAALAVACAIVITTAGAAYAGADHYRGRVSIAGRGSTPASTTTTVAPTTTSNPITTMMPSSASIASPAPTTAAGDPTTTLPEAEVQPSDLEGTLQLDTTTLTAEQPTAFTLTVRNSTDRPVRFGTYPAFGISLAGVGANVQSVAVPEIGLVLTPRQSQSFESTLTPAAGMVGPAVVSAAFLGGHNPPDGPCCDVPYPVAGVAPVPVTVVPPGWADGQPLDPSQGKWSATMSANSSEVRVGDSVTISASISNVGDALQNTEGYGSLAIVCRRSDNATPYWTHGGFIAPATMAPGATRTFSFDFRPDDGLDGTATCFLGLAFHGDQDQAQPRVGIDSDSVAVVVLPATPTTTTTTTPAPAVEP